ncbi:LysR family transcriptional regulator [Motilimonas pumila]|uniref:LysR family transcriptional regulator n=1 Tax=Motilimonas pumila TaxID=2303987 RepID=A0A418YHU0_9GAMM|nr:LysR family transcriptional regulator [Motilimonas pumila]RJG49896.1 LysR family transcriptional regulator [Motilimonas pumila]
MSRWQGVSEFVAVVQSHSFTGAANKLGTSVVQISRRVSALETRLGVKLLHRTTRKVSLTTAGEIYFNQCQLLVEGLEMAELAVTQMQLTPSGKLKITAPMTYGEKFIAPVILDFLAAYPQIDIELILTNQTLDLIDNNIDIAIRLGHLTDSSLKARKLATRQLYVCASPAYLERSGEPHTLSELSQHSCLVGSVDFWRFREQDKGKSLKVSGRIKCNSGLALLEAASKGVGLVQLPDYYVRRGLDEGSLVEVLQAYRDQPEGIWALFPPTKRTSVKVRLLLDFLVERLAEPSMLLDV